MSSKNEYTGKKYRCIGLEENNKSNWEQYFYVGDEVNEIKNDNLPFGVLMLEPKHWNLVGIYVDANQFELVEDENQ